MPKDEFSYGLSSGGAFFVISALIIVSFLQSYENCFIFLPFDCIASLAEINICFAKI